ncbi:hypothetical protein V8G54_026962 [Vigna mungo]|uniref:Reverse transcriptase Ty1/copia-type domain-containing protein n=1 Tax=Vigna mungo TaxID=3915 RepID=A0AAQ3N0H9_VIGMU
MNYSPTFDNCSFPYNAQPPQFNLFCEHFSECALQQTPPCFRAYGEQQSWPMQQQLPHLYWDQYAEPEQENFQSEQPWQPTFCDQWQQEIPTFEIQGLTTQGKLKRRKELSITEAPLTVAAATKFQEIECPTTSVYSNPSFTDSHYALNSTNVDSLMSDDCMSASIDISECVYEPYDHNYTVADFEKLVASFRELAMIHDCNSFFIVLIYDFTTASAQLSDNVYYDGDNLKLVYCEMDFDADVCEPEIDFTVVDFTPCFGHSNVTNSAFSIDRVHILACSVFYDCTDLNALLDDESDAYDDRYTVFDDVKVEMTDFENACIDLNLELELEFAEFLNSEEFIVCKLHGNDPVEAVGEQRILNDAVDESIKDLGELQYFLGFEVAGSRKGIYLCQRKYALDIFEETGMIGSKPCSTTFLSNTSSLYKDENYLDNPSAYRKLIGKLFYLTNTRPDLCFTVNLLS